MSPEDYRHLKRILVIAVRSLDADGRRALAESVREHPSSDLRRLVEEVLEDNGEDRGPSQTTAATPIVSDAPDTSLADKDPAASTHAAGNWPYRFGGAGLHVRCPHCLHPIEITEAASLADIVCGSCGSHVSLVDDGDATRAAQELTKISHFELQERLGVGGFGTVWKARDTHLDRLVALKIPRVGQIGPDIQERFFREARAASQLSHSNIVAVHEVGRFEGSVFIVSDFVKGVSLSDYLTAGRQLSTDEVLELCEKIARALQHAHKSGVIHRDLKPQNILVDDEGEPHITDFGLAKRDSREVTMTVDGEILGTPAYMSPEQATGMGHSADARSDVYSLGVVLFRLLTGELPFRGNSKMMIYQVIHDAPPRPRKLRNTIPLDAETICLKCLEKDPQRRYQTAEELADDLHRASTLQPVHARPLGHLARFERWCRRNPNVAGMMALILCILATTAVVTSTLAWSAHRSAKRADIQSKRAVTALETSLDRELQLTTQLRRQGYGDTVRKLLQQWIELPGGNADPAVLRQHLVRTMGDFVAKSPRVLTPPRALSNPITATRLSPKADELWVGYTDGKLFRYRLTVASQEPTELESLGAPVQAICFSENGQRVTAVDRTGMVRRWTRVNDEWTAAPEFRAGPGNGEELQTAIASPTGEWIALWEKPSDEQRTIELWNVQDQTRAATLEVSANWQMRNCAFDPTRQRLAASYMHNQDRLVGWVLWDLSQLETEGQVSQIHAVEMPSLGASYSNSIAFGPAGEYLAIGFDQGMVVYDMETLEQTSKYWLDATKAVAFSPDDRMLAAVSLRGDLTIWNPKTKRQTARLSSLTRRDSRENISFSNDGTHLVASSADAISIWDLTVGRSERVELAGHSEPVPTLAFHPQEPVLLSGGKDQLIRFWDLETRELLDSREFDQEIQALAFGNDQLLAVGLVDDEETKKLQLLDYETREILSEVDPGFGHVYSVSLAADNQRAWLAACGVQGGALWQLGDEPGALQLDTNWQQSDWCLSIRLSRDGQWFVFSGDRTIYARDIRGQRSMELSAPPMLQGWHGLDFLGASNDFVYITREGKAMVWQVETDKQIREFGEAESFAAPHIAVSRDGKWLAGLSQPNTVSVWEVATGNRVIELNPATSEIWALAWSADNARLASGHIDGSVIVWELSRMNAELKKLNLDWE